MDEIDLDRELQSMLTVPPSPDFVARVREKIADAPRPSMLAGWLKPAAALAFAAIMAIAVGLRNETAPVTAGLKPSAAPVTAGLKASTTNAFPVVEPTFRSAEPVVEPTFSPAVALAARAGRSAEPAARAIASAPAAAPSLPEVLIATEDIEALQDFVAGANQLRFVASFDETPESTPWVMSELGVRIFMDASDEAPAHNN